jgi:hypothetical protein
MNSTKPGNRNAAIAAISIVSVLALGVVPATGAPAQHDRFEEESDTTFSFGAGEGPCVEWAGTMREVRSTRYKVLTPGGARHPDELLTNGVVDGFVELVPDDPGFPSYAGTFREKVNGAVTVTEDGDELRIANYRARSVLTGTDGSSVTLVLSGKITVNGRGELVIDEEQFACS